MEKYKILRAGPDTGVMKEETPYIRVYGDDSKVPDIAMVKEFESPSGAEKYTREVIERLSEKLQYKPWGAEWKIKGFFLEGVFSSEDKNIIRPYFGTLIDANKENAKQIARKVAEWEAEELVGIRIKGYGIPPSEIFTTFTLILEK